MKYSDDDLKELQQISYKYSLYRTADFDLSDEVAMKTGGIFLLKANTIDKSNFTGWIIKSSNNLIQEHYRKTKKENENIEKYQYDLLQKYNSHLTSEQYLEFKGTFNEVLKTLDIEEMKTILLYFQCEQKLTTMHQLLNNVSYATLRKKISRIKNKLKAETYKKLGIVATKRIVTPKLAKQIIDFLKSFKKNLEANSLEKMYYYFSKIDLDNYNPTYEIKKILDYEIQMNDSVYRVWVIYKSKANSTDSFYIEFYLDDHNRLKVITPPVKNKKVFKLKSNSEDGKKILELLKNAKIDNSGISKFSSEELEKILQKLEG